VKLLHSFALQACNTVSTYIPIEAQCDTIVQIINLLADIPSWNINQDRHFYKIAVLVSTNESEHTAFIFLCLVFAITIIRNPVSSALLQMIEFIF
jgi:hypothetical protein